jgi:hypothetical protein
MSKPRKPRRKPLNVDAVIEMAAFRNHMRAIAAESRRQERLHAPWKRIVGKLVVTAITLGFASIVIAHAMAG